MPYTVIEQDDGRYCVHRVLEDGGLGDEMGCHDTQREALSQLWALYAREADSKSWRLAWTDDAGSHAEDGGLLRRQAAYLAEQLFGAGATLLALHPQWAVVAAQGTAKAMRFDIQSDGAQAEVEERPLEEAPLDGWLMLPAVKAGARNSAEDRRRIRDIRGLARQIIALTMEMEPSDSEEEYRARLAEALGRPDILVVEGTQIKSLGNGRIGGYLVVFGDPEHTDLSRFRDFFTRETDFGLEEDGTGKSIVLYHHGQDPVLGARRLGVAHLKLTDVGVWAEAQLALRDEYERQLIRLIEAGKMGWSSGTAGHLVRRVPQPNGSHWIAQWWLGLDASITPTPAEPRTTVLPLKSWLADREPAVKALGWPSAAEAHRTGPAATPHDLSDDNKEHPMDKQLQEIVAQAAQAAADAAAKSVLAKLTETPANQSPGYAGDDGDQAPTTKIFNAVYVSRFGEPDAAYKAVMTDILGRDFRQALYDQARLFARYLRFGDSEMTTAERALLRTQIFPEPTLKSLIESGADVREIKAIQNETQGTLGGYAVPPSVQTEIIRRLPGLTAVRGQGARVHLLQNTNSTEFPVYTGGDNAYVGALRGAWAGEGALPPERNFTLGQVTVVAHVYTFKIPMTQNMVEDTANLVNLVVEDISTTMSLDEDAAFLTGDGVGKPTGILPGGLNAHGLKEVNSGAAGAVTAAGVKKLKHGVAKQYRRDGVWVAETDTFAAIEALTEGSGTPAFPEMSEKEELRGRPYFEIEAMPSVAANTYPLIYGNMNGYWIVERPGMTIVRFQDSATGINRVEFHVRKRVGGYPVEPWKFAVMKIAA